MYELPANLPIDRTLEIAVMDHDLLSANDLIGKTTIDLENCYLKKYLTLYEPPQSFHKLVSIQVPTLYTFWKRFCIVLVSCDVFNVCFHQGWSQQMVSSASAKRDT